MLKSSSSSWAFLLLALLCCSFVDGQINRFPRILLVDGKRVDPCSRDTIATLGSPTPGPFFSIGNVVTTVPTLFDQEALNCPSMPPQGSTIFLDVQATNGPFRTFTITTEGQAVNQPGALPAFGPLAANANGFACLSFAGQPCSAGCDNAFDQYVVSQPVANPNTYQFSIRVGVALLPAPGIPGVGAAFWNAPALRLEPLGSRRLCLRDPTEGRALFTGAYFRVVFDCNQVGVTCAADPLSLAAGQTLCCLSTVQQQRVGVCVDPRTSTCCGSAPVRASREKCCNQATEVVQYLGAPCPCSTASVCVADPTNPEVELTCCQATKYPEFASLAVPTGRTDGQCFNSSSHLCCNTGFRFDSGSQQCCAINGLQSRDLPCPCSTNDHCRADTVGSGTPANNNFTCCFQTSPPLPEIQACSIYQNYPNGTGALEAQSCHGLCINNEYQICCNGHVCQRAFEKCCNTTCCNRYIGSCEQSRRAGAPRQFFNYLFRPTNDQIRFNPGTFITCSIVEQMSVLKSFFIFILPTFLLAGMLLGLALVLVFANQVSARLFTTEERALLVFGVLTTLFAFPLFFSPFWKFGVVIQAACIIAIVAAAALNFPLAIFAALLVLIAFLYAIDPFHGNGYLNFAEGRLDNGDIDPWTSGVLWSVYKMWREVEPGRVEGEITRDLRFCTRYYDYFAFDYGVQDFIRFDNPAVTTFGYCSRGWTFTLLMFCGFMIIFLVLTLALLLMVALQRFRSDVYEPIELEIRDANQVVDPFLQ